VANDEAVPEVLPVVPDLAVKFVHPVDDVIQDGWWGSLAGKVGPESRRPELWRKGSRVERWRGGLGKPCVLPALSVAGARVSPHAPFPPPARRTGRADLPHPALRRSSAAGPRAGTPACPSPAA
jgi:hypothetical protein